jgi:SAM-dependent methyltransferase
MSTHGHHHHEAAGHGHSDELAELLELDAEVLHEYHAGVFTWVRSQFPDGAVRHVADLGAGTGAGTFGLLARFGEATVTAVDSDPAMLARLAANAAARGLGDRVRTLPADLDAGWPAGLSGLDLVWAANSMHHMADPAQVLADLGAALAPGGRLALAELDMFPRFLPDGDGLEERCHTAMAAMRAHDMPHLGADWAAVIAAAGLTVRARRRFDVHLDAPLPPSAVRYAEVSLRRTRDAVAGVLSAGDVAALDALLAGGLDGAELTVRAARTVWIAAQP